MKFAIVTLFPEMFVALQNYGVSGRAVKAGLVEITCINPRDFTKDIHRTVDDRPYGGGPGMVMLAEPMLAAIDAAKVAVASDVDPEPKVVYLSPQGVPFTQQLAGTEVEVNDPRPIVFVAGRYEGIDERIIEMVVDEEWSLGDYVLSGGELAAMVMMDAMIRLVPGALGHKGSAQEDSFVAGLLDCPHYTRPEEYQGRKVPEVLLSGNHKLIEQWRLKQALGRTWERRPDLLAQKQLSKLEQRLLSEYQQEKPESRHS